MRSRRLGNELRDLRKASKLSAAQVAEHLGCGQPKISKIENGERGIRPADLCALLDLYGVTDDKFRERIKQLARDVYKVDWWTAQGPLIHDTLRDYLTLESDSSLIREYEHLLVPGLLQSEGYMREIFFPALPKERAEALIEARLARKRLLDDHLGFRLRAVIDEPALHRMPGGRAVAVEQLTHLDEVSIRPNVTIQVLPLKVRLPLNQYVPFGLYTLRGTKSINVVWLEHLESGTLLEQKESVKEYTQAWEELTAAAMSPSASRKFIQGLIEEYQR